MNGGILGAVSALWLGILTSISPCPLATNIAAISFVGSRVGSPPRMLFSGLTYTLGRVVAYTLLGALVVSGLFAIPVVSNFLQEHLNRLLGPLLVVIGLVLLGIIPVPGSGGFLRWDGLRKGAQGGGVWSAASLGFVFALALCPVSAALFFGSLIPLAVKARSHFLYPALYGAGTGLPVFAFVVVIALGVRSLNKIVSDLARVELWARRGTGVTFIGIGVYYALVYLFGVIS